MPWHFSCRMWSCSESNFPCIISIWKSIHLWQQCKENINFSSLGIVFLSGQCNIAYDSGEIVKLTACWQPLRNRGNRETKKWASCNFDVASWRSHVSKTKHVAEHLGTIIGITTFIKCQPLSVEWANFFNL